MREYIELNKMNLSNLPGWEDAIEVNIKVDPEKGLIAKGFNDKGKEICLAEWPNWIGSLKEAFHWVHLNLFQEVVVSDEDKKGIRLKDDSILKKISEQNHLTIKPSEYLRRKDSF